jgi:hypothetical protein
MPALDANTVVAKCIAAVYEAAERYRPLRIGTWAGRVIPKSDGSSLVKIRVSIDYPDGQQKFAPIDCTIDNVGNITIVEHRE